MRIKHVISAFFNGFFLTPKIIFQFDTFDTIAIYGWKGFGKDSLVKLFLQSVREILRLLEKRKGI